MTSHDERTSVHDAIQEPAALADGFRGTDVGNSLRLVAIADGRVRYVREWGKFIVYRDGVWLIDHHDVLVRGYAKLTARWLFDKAMQRDISTDARDALLAWGKRSESRERISAMVDLVRNVPGVLIEHTELDQRHELLNVLNGTVDLRTGELLPHDPEHLITKQLPVSYDPGAECPTWDRCLREWQPDEAMRLHLQEKAGAAATGYSPEEFDIHWGTGGNGKGKYFGQIMYVLGDYATVPHKSLVVAQRFEQHETVMADLFGVRLAVAAETHRGDRLDEEKIKALTGGDRLRARRMREDSWRFDPTHCLCLHTNYRPHVRGTDEGIWRRVNLVPWTQSFIGEGEDVKLAEKLRAEASGTLNWIVEGARRWLASDRKFTVPNIIQEASRAYRMTANPTHHFMRTVTVQQAGLFEATEVLHDTYMAWRSADDIHDEPPAYLTVDALAKELVTQGYRRKLKRVDGRVMRGFEDVAVRPEWAAYVEAIRTCCPERFTPTLGELSRAFEDGKHDVR